MADYRAKFAEGQSAFDADPDFRLKYLGAEKLEDKAPWFKESYVEGQSIYDHQPSFKLSYVELQTMVEFIPSPWYDADTEGSDMSTEIFPEVPGLMFDIKRRPMFSNRVQDHVSGQETRLAYWENPKWEFEIAYEYLPNEPKSSGNTDLEKIMGFFLKRKGNFQSFLYRFQDDYRAVSQILGQGDGGNSEFKFIRTIGVWSGAVDYVDYTVAPPVLYWDYASAPYTVAAGTFTVGGPPNLTEIGSVMIGATVLTLVVSAPAANQYTYNSTTGVFTFNSSRSGQVVNITGTRTMQVSEYTLTVPNLVLFSATPPSTVTVKADFYFYFAVRFLESEADFNLFYDKLYDLQELSLRSIIV